MIAAIVKSAVKKRPDEWVFDISHILHRVQLIQDVRPSDGIFAALGREYSGNKALSHDAQPTLNGRLR